MDHELYQILMDIKYKLDYMAIIGYGYNPETGEFQTRNEENNTNKKIKIRKSEE